MATHDLPAPELLPRAVDVLQLPAPIPLVEAFLEGRSAHTLRMYRQDLKDFRAFVQAESLEDAARLLVSLDGARANALVLAYRAHMKKRGLQAATINHRLAALRSLCKLARMLGLCSFSLEIENLRVEAYRDTRGPALEVVSELLSALEGKTSLKERRDYAMLRLLFDLALRRSEVVGLDQEHVDLKRGVVRVLGKGRSGREVLSLPQPTRDALRAWLKVRGEEPGPLFPNFHHASPDGKRLSSTGLYLVIRQLGEELGLKIRPHGLRHAAITQALELTGGDVRAVQRFSRHKDLKVVARYDDARRDLGGEVARLVAQSVKKTSE